jgi:aspartate/methionine/tyrosine aminotransferase
MEILARARALEAAGRRVIHMEIGEPDFPTPAPIVRAGMDALGRGLTHYTEATGLPALREAIAASYRPHADIAPDRVVVTPGSSGALQLIIGMLIDPGDEVLMADPGYPCNRHFVRLYDGRPVLIPVGPETRYQLTADLVRANWTQRTRGVLIASPSNPTGTVLSTAALREIAGEVESRGGFLIVDEIYRGLCYEDEPLSACAITDRAFVVNSFSKYYGMTGWRLGWTVMPREFSPIADRLAQNIFLAPGTVAQHAALAAFNPETQTELVRRREEFRARRDFLLPRLREIGFRIPVTPQGAFYIYADCSALSPDSASFARDLLEVTGVAITPGLDFGEHRPNQHLRFSYACAIEKLGEAMRLLAGYLA